MQNDSEIQIFHKYERLTKASGLKLNADKTVKLNSIGQNVAGGMGANNVTNCITRFWINTQNEIKKWNHLRSKWELDEKEQTLRLYNHDNQHGRTFQRMKQDRAIASEKNTNC